MKTISTVSTLIDVSSSTIRRWERQGIIPWEVNRDHYGRRMFSDDQIAALVIIRERMAQKRFSQIPGHHNDGNRTNQE